MRNKKNEKNEKLKGWVVFSQKISLKLTDTIKTYYTLDPM